MKNVASNGNSAQRQVEKLHQRILRLEQRVFVIKGQNAALRRRITNTSDRLKMMRKIESLIERGNSPKAPKKPGGFRFRCDAIRELLEENELSLTQFGKRVGITRQAVAFYLDQKMNPSLKTIGRMQAEFKKTLEFFVETEVETQEKGDANGPAGQGNRITQGHGQSPGSGTGHKQKDR